MKLEFWGVRGSFPLASGVASKIGGNTPCAAVTAESGDVAIIDSGTGIRALGATLLARRKPGPLRLSVLFTHFHLDHVQGLPFFAPLHVVDAEIGFYSAIDPDAMRGYLNRLMGKPYFPLPFDRTPAQKTFHKIADNEIRIGSLRISACPLHHPQGAVAYRFEENGAALVLATDTEPDAGPLDARLTEFARGSCLVGDAMFTPEEYAAGKQGWGHGTWRDAAALASAARASGLYLSHFNFDHSDRVIAGLARRARAIFPAARCAREGLCVELAGPAAHRKEAERS